MKRILLVLGAAILFVNTLVIPTAVRADGGTGSTSAALTLAVVDVIVLSLYLSNRLAALTKMEQG